MPCFLWKKSDRWGNNFKLQDAICLSPWKLWHHVIMLNFYFPNMGIHCSSFPPHCSTCRQMASSLIDLQCPPSSVMNHFPLLTNIILPPSTNSIHPWQTVSCSTTLLLPWQMVSSLTEDQCPPSLEKWCPPPSVTNVSAPEPQTVELSHYLSHLSWLIGSQIRAAQALP